MYMLSHVLTYRPICSAVLMKRWENIDSWEEKEKNIEINRKRPERAISVGM